MPDTQPPYVRSVTRVARVCLDPAGAGICKRGSTPADAGGGAPRGQLDLIAPRERARWFRARPARGAGHLPPRLWSRPGFGPPVTLVLGGRGAVWCHVMILHRVAEISAGGWRGHALAQVCELIRRGGSCYPARVSLCLFLPRGSFISADD